MVKVTRLIQMVRNMFTSKAPADHALILEYGYKTKTMGSNPAGYDSLREQLA